MTPALPGKQSAAGLRVLDGARSAFPLPGQDICEEGLHDSGEIAGNAFELLNKALAQREIDRRLARRTGAATLRSHTFGDGQCALLRGPTDTSRNSASAVSHPMAGMESFRLRPQGQLLAGTCDQQPESHGSRSPMSGAPTPRTPYPRTVGLGAGRSSIFAPPQRDPARTAPVGAGLSRYVNPPFPLRRRLLHWRRIADRP